MGIPVTLAEAQMARLTEGMAGLAHLIAALTEVVAKQSMSLACISQQVAMMAVDTHDGFLTVQGVGLDVANIDKEIKSISFRLFHEPQIAGVLALSQEEDMFEFAFTLVPPAAADEVTKRNITVTIGDVPVTATLADPNSTQSPTFRGAVGDAVSAYLTDWDQAGNQSPDSEPYGWVVEDKIPPQKPGQIAGVVELAEVDDSLPRGLVE